MAVMIVKHLVKDFGVWKKGFESSTGLRKSNGMVSETVFQDASDPNLIIVLLKWDSLERAKKFSQSDEIKASMEKAGLVGRPEFNLMNEV
jgi:quinol monooxygenase YgiN